MALTKQEMMQAYQDLIAAYPEDLRIARPLIQMLQARGDKEAARNLAMEMARRMVSLGYSSYALAFLSLCEQLGHPDTDEIESMKTIAELTLGSPPQSLSEAGKVFSLIEALSDSESQEFLRQGTLRKVKKGEVIVKQGEISHNFYLILEGEVHVQVNTKSGEHFEVGSLKQGDFFGEVACIYQLPRTATVQAFVDSTLLEFSDKTVDAMVHMSPIAGDSLMKVVQRRMIETISFMHPAFTKLGAEDRQWLEEDSELVEYFPGRVLRKDSEAEKTSVFYVIVFGKVEAKRNGKTKCTLGVNAMYGNASPILRLPDDTELVAVERTLACRMPLQIFDTFYNTYAGFELWVNNHVGKRNGALGSSVILNN
ncbi:cyclic nucleotide-binding domain-containing protein [Ghiorsea bivora]|uniref:cyclic nucleotide-binding domain-containing protein n=1 Tax=Ghiorsea bivora TaxID=1485545 RepID=UPI0005715B26|nr:cyclic nucleotide-binding domain-containing protein [Ghiorsea bivora]